MRKKIFLTGLFLMLVGCSFFVVAYKTQDECISAIYYYHPNCGHCNQIKNLMVDISNNYNIEWVDTSEQKSYPIDGTPTLIVHTSDGRNVYLVGSADIPKYAKCELQEQSTKECMTLAQLNPETNSYFR